MYIYAVYLASLFVHSHETMLSVQVRRTCHVSNPNSFLSFSLHSSAQVSVSGPWATGRRTSKGLTEGLLDGLLEGLPTCGSAPPSSPATNPLSFPRRKN